jgi:putative ATP-dependent endonuclease of OLD family
VLRLATEGKNAGDMHIVFVEIENFRGIKKTSWAPQPGINCLIGPGDSTKTTILDAIELALNPRSYWSADDYDFHNLDVGQDISVVVTIGGLPTEFKAENRYGLHLRGWSAAGPVLHDEPAEGLEDVLSIRLSIDESLEARWSLYNKRIDEAESDPPMIRYKDMKQLATTRLGPFAERHLGWGRQSVLSQLEKSGESVSLRLAQASRAARQAFKTHGQEVFKDAAERVQKLGKEFSVPVKEKYKAELDIQSVSVNAGGIALHDGDLPLRRLGTGSSRLLVSALQHDAASQSHIALIDEIEHGLEPHRIARLLKYLQTPEIGTGEPSKGQIFLTTHSPVVIRELAVSDIHTVCSKEGHTTVNSVKEKSRDPSKTQGHLRASPEAFLAPRILVGEGKTECGLARGLDAWWASKGKGSFAFQGVVAIHGDGKDSAPETAETLLGLDYGVALLLDSDEEPNPETLKRVRDKGGIIVQWAGQCSTE